MLQTQCNTAVPVPVLHFYATLCACPAHLMRQSLNNSASIQLGLPRHSFPITLPPRAAYQATKLNPPFTNQNSRSAAPFVPRHSSFVLRPPSFASVPRPSLPWTRNILVLRISPSLVPTQSPVFPSFCKHSITSATLTIPSPFWSLRYFSELGSGSPLIVWPLYEVTMSTSSIVT